MLRRDFLGSSFAILATTGLPFIARAADDPIFVPTGEERQRAILRLLKAERQAPQDVRSILVVRDGPRIKGAGLKERVVQSRFLSYEFNGLMATEVVVFAGSVLIWNERGRLIQIDLSPFRSGSQTLHNGDQLKLTHSINAECGMIV